LSTDGVGFRQQDSQVTHLDAGSSVEG